MREHVRDLAKELDVTVVYVGDLGRPRDVWGQAIQHPCYELKTERVVLLSHKPTTPMTYMVAMHELGHCEAGDGWSAGTVLEREAAAWEWAIVNAILPRSLASHHARGFMHVYRTTENLAGSERFERLYARVSRNSRSHRQRKR
jgi:hypothetical protein